MSFRHDSLKPKTVDVLDRHTSVLYAVPPAAVVHLPADADKQRPVLCTKFDPKRPDKSCPAKKGCKYAHVDVRRATGRLVHVHYSYASPQECRYACHAPGATLAIKEPPSSHLTDLVDAVPSECVIKTKAKLSDDRPTARCCHFYYNRECRLGAACEFAHVIHLSPDGVGFVRAPAPYSFGRGRDATDGEAAPYGEAQRALALQCSDARAAAADSHPRTPTTGESASDEFPFTYWTPAGLHVTSLPGSPRVPPPGMTSAVTLADVMKSPKDSAFDDKTGFDRSRISSLAASWHVTPHKPSEPTTFGALPTANPSARCSFSLACGPDEFEWSAATHTSVHSSAVPTPHDPNASPVWWAHSDDAADVSVPESPPMLGRTRSGGRWRHNPYA